MSDRADIASNLAPTGMLRAVINLGNPVLAQGWADQPSGVTVDLAGEIAARIRTPLELLCVTAARDSFAAIVEGRADIGFVAIDPKRAEALAFTPPYAVIEGVYAVPNDSAIQSLDDVDRAGVRVGVKLGSAYDLAATRLLEHAEVVRGDDGTAVFTELGLDVAAGIRNPVTDFATRHGLRVLEPAFTKIEQAVAVSADRPTAVVSWLAQVVEELTANGYVANSLQRSGRNDASVVLNAQKRNGSTTSGPT